jgi:hypothetical protein
MANLSGVLQEFVSWLTVNVRPFSYLLPDSIELVLCLGLLAYSALQLQQQL